MSASNRHFEVFNDHTLLKHAVLRAYLQRWAFKILRWGGAGQTVCFVDGFAGAGCDEQGNHGSPVIACRIAQQVRGHFDDLGRPQARLRIMAVERKRAWFVSLTQQLAPFARQDPDNVKAFHGVLSDHMPALRQQTEGRPTLFFLDPFGVGLDAATYPVMLAGKHNEILALFADMGASRLRGVVHSATDVERQLRTVLMERSLFPELDQEAVERLETEASRKVRAAEPFRPAALKLISRALGESDWVEDLRGLASREVREELMVRFAKKLLASGANQVLVLPMRDARGNHKYSLVHASQSLKGYTAMKEAISESLNKADLAQTMRLRIRDDLTVPMSKVIAFLRGRFAGLTTRWTGDAGEDKGSVKRVLLNETEVFPFQCEQIRDKLLELRWLQRENRRLVCTIPDA